MPHDRLRRVIQHQAGGTRSHEKVAIRFSTDLGRVKGPYLFEDAPEHECVVRAWKTLFTVGLDGRVVVNLSERGLTNELAERIESLLGRSRCIAPPTMGAPVSRAVR